MDKVKKENCGWEIDFSKVRINGRGQDNGY